MSRTVLYVLYRAAKGSSRVSRLVIHFPSLLACLALQTLQTLVLLWNRFSGPLRLGRVEIFDAVLSETSESPVSQSWTSALCDTEDQRSAGAGAADPLIWRRRPPREGAIARQRGRRQITTSSCHQTKLSEPDAATSCRSAAEAGRWRRRAMGGGGGAVGAPAGGSERRGCAAPAPGPSGSAGRPGSLPCTIFTHAPPPAH